MNRKKGIEIQFKPSYKQGQAFEYLTDHTTNFVGYGGSGFSGKSYLECYWLTIMSVGYPGTGWFLARSTLTVLKDTVLKTLFKVFAECNILPDRDYKLNSQTNVITFTNGSEIFLLDLAYAPSDSLYTWLGGYEFTGGAVDESGECHETAIEILSTRIGRRLNDKYNLTAKILETFNPLKNHVYRRYYKPSVKGNLKPEFKFVKALPTDNPSPEVGPYIARILATGNKTTIERLIRGNFEYDDDPAALIIFDKITDVFSNKHVPSGRKCMTNDLARLGGDNIVSIEWDGFRGYVTATSKQTLDVTGDQIEHKRVRVGIGKSDVLCDEDGLGGGVVDYQHYKGFVNNSRPMPNPENSQDPENYDNLKSQCSFRMAQRVNNNGLYLVCAEKWMEAFIVEEMEQVKQKAMDTDQKKGVVPKKMMKEILGRSPDFWDTIMMREWFELKPMFVVAVDAV